jgi:hypothetical protein
MEQIEKLIHDFCIGGDVKLLKEIKNLLDAIS